MVHRFSYWLGCGAVAASLGLSSVVLQAQEVVGASQRQSTAALQPDALHAAVRDLPADVGQAIEGFYANRGGAPFWSEAGSGRLETLIAALSRSDEQGLPLSRYDAAGLAGPLNDAAAEVQREVGAMQLFLRYGSDLSAGIVTPSKIDPEITLKPRRTPAALLLATLDNGPLAQVLADLEPAEPDYRLLVAEKRRLEGLLASDAWGPEIAPGPTLKEGESSPRVSDLRARLERMGYAAPTDALGAAAYGASLVSAVERFQRDLGLNDDGVAGPQTLAAINTSPQARLKQVLVNLERMRWTNGDWERRYLFVNIPDYSVTLYEDGDAVYRTKSIVGSAAETRTPEFSDVMSYFVVNPSWNIPYGIATRVYLPKLKRDAGVLAANGMVLMTRAGTPIDPRLVDFRQVNASNFPFRIRQKPSLDNALGRVKFMFPNQFAIYLHDTPARELFAKDDRALSNGCVRLQKPLELAYELLRGQVDDPQGSFDAWLAADKERTVNLERPIPVHIVYRTVFAQDDGVVRYRADVYGRDRAVFAALEAAGVTLPAAQG